MADGAFPTQLISDVQVTVNNDGSLVITDLVTSEGQNYPDLQTMISDALVGLDSSELRWRLNRIGMGKMLKEGTLVPGNSPKKRVTLDLSQPTNCVTVADLA